MQLVNLVLDSDVEMDEFSETSVSNQAHQVIYRSIHEKLVVLQENKDRFRDESDRMYQEAIEKYQEQRMQ